MTVATETEGYALEAIHHICPELRFREDDKVLLTPAQVEKILRCFNWKTPSEWREAQSSEG